MQIKTPQVKLALRVEEAVIEVAQTAAEPNAAGSQTRLSGRGSRLW